MTNDQAGNGTTDSVRPYMISLYLAAAFAISWIGVWLVIRPYTFPSAPGTPATAVALGFVFMAAGPPAASLIMTRIFDGWAGTRDLFGRIVHWRVPGRYYAIALLVVPATAAVVLAVATLMSAHFTPGPLAGRDPLNTIVTGIAMGLMAGWFEEIGWSGFALHRLLQQSTIVRAGLLLGLIHGVWHLYIGYWGEGARYGNFYLPYFLLLWILGLVALRLLIAWLYDRTRSVLIAQLAHASYTGSLLVLWPAATSPLEDTMWAGAFAIVLLVVVSGILLLAPKRAA